WKTLLSDKPFDVTDTGDAPHGANQSLQLLLVADIQGHFDQRSIRGGYFSASLEAADICIVGRENGRDLRQQSGPVVGVDYDLDRERIGRIPRPFDVDFALDVVH